MTKPAALEKLTGIASLFAAFVAERHPFALDEVMAAYETVARREPADEAALRDQFRRELTKRLSARPAPEGIAETTPRIAAQQRLQQALQTLIDDCDGFLRRQAIVTSLTRDERLEI